MQLSRLKICNFRCFGPNTTTIDFKRLTTFIGANSSGKTAAIIALMKLFGSLPSDREILRSDFHLPTGKKASELDDCELFIEAVFDFPEIEDSNSIDAAIPSFFRYFVVSKEGEKPYIRIRLESTFSNDGSQEGLIETNYYFIVTAETEEITESVKKSANKNVLSNVRCIYVPAIRNPTEQLKNVTGTLLNRLLRNIKWDAKTKKMLEGYITKINSTVQEVPDINEVNTVLQSQWTSFHDDKRYGNAIISVNSSDVDTLLKHTEVKFAPTELPRDYDVSELGDGLRSLFYFSLVNTLLELETKLLKELSEKPAETDKKLIPPPVLTLIAVEEPENHIAPQLLGKVIINLKKTAELSNAQVVLSSHSASIVKRVDATTLRYFRIDESSVSAVKKVLLPDKTSDQYKFVKGAVEAYPEIYFARKVVLGEGESEAIVLPYLIERLNAHADVLGISVAPLGGRHVNYFWKLLSDLGIPYVTLLDLDKERFGGGWGRLKYAVQELIKVGTDKTELLLQPDGTQLTMGELAEMHSWSVDDKRKMNFWIRKLEKLGVYYSAPLDLDFCLLELFPDAYKATVDDYGPRISGEGKVIDIENGDKLSKAYSDRIKKDTRATLKEEGGNGHTYSPAQKKLMIWYKHLFLGRGKPVTHLLALPNCTINTMDDIPLPLKKVVVAAMQ